MAILVDCIIIGIIALSIYMGYKKGLIGVGFKVITFLLAILITGILYYPIANFVISNTTLDETIAQAIEKNFISEQEKEEPTENTTMPQAIVRYIDNYATQAKDASVQLVAQQLSLTIVRAGVALALFVLVRMILAIFKIFSEFIASLPLIKQCNTLGGIAYGVIKGLFIVYLVLAILSLIAPMVSNLGILEAIGQSQLGSMMYNHNLILLLLFRK